MGGIGGILLLSMLGASVTGVVVAGIAKMVLPGRQAVSGIEMFLIGTGAAWVGGFIAGLLGWGENRSFGIDDILVLAIQVALAAVAIYLWTNFRNNQIKKQAAKVVPPVPDIPGPVGGTSDKKDKSDKGGPGVPGVPGV